MNTVHKPKPKKSKRRVATAATLALLVPTVSGGLIYAASSSDSLPIPQITEEELRVLVVDTVVAEIHEEYPVNERFVGRTEAARTSNLGFELAGTVTSIAKDEGQRVEMGQVLATLDTSRLDARREELVALKDQAEASLTLAESTLKRFNSAVQSNAVSRQQVDEANETKLNASAAVTRVRSQIKAIDVDLEKSILRAPFTGVVSRRSVDEGTIVSPGMPVLSLVEVDHLEVRVGFSLRAASGLKAGDNLNVNPATASGMPVQAEVVRILPERGQRTRTIDVILSIDSPATSGIRPGDLLEVPVTRTVKERGIWLPRTALTESSRGLWAGYVLTKDNMRAADGAQIYRIERRQLEVIDQLGESVYVRGAMGEGDIVVSTGLQRLSPGQRVRIGPEKAPSPAPSTSQPILGIITR